jgi:beta-glucuronidase
VPDRNPRSGPVFTFRVMRRLALAATLALVAAAPAVARAADVPSDRTLYADGPEGRYLMEGEWLFRLDREDRGVRDRLFRRRARAGWTQIRAPHAWNVGDDSVASMVGTVGWYRKDFRLPNARAALHWAVRFESVNNRATVWLNGRRMGGHRGAYLPFTVLLDGVRRRGVNRLVVRVDSRRRRTDFPPGRRSETTGLPAGGWWNYGGLLREVYLQRLDTAQIVSALVIPRLGCRTCPAVVRMRARVRNVTRATRRLTVTGRFGARRARLGTRTLGPGRTVEFASAIRIGNPRLWSPQRPYLYPASIAVRGGRRKVADWTVASGVRSVKVVAGRLYLNGRPVSIRGVGMHEDSRAQGAAVDNAWRRTLVREAQALGASMLRTHYPLHPYLHELADRNGLLVWSEIPLYQLETALINDVEGRAVGELRDNIWTNGSHASVVVWSIANELSSKPGATQARYIRVAARAARELDGTRPVGLAVAGYPSSGCHAAYRPLDIVGINDYFGWYAGPAGSVFDRAALSGYLDALRGCYGREAIMITEFGAEANRDGPAEDKGTYAFQQDFVNFHLGVFATKPWLSGALYWALNEFRARPEWEGGNPWPAPPVHQKGLVSYDGVRKPAWADVQRWFTQTPQF